MILNLAPTSLSRKLEIVEQRAARRVAAHHRLTCQRILEGARLRGLEGRADAGRDIGAAEILELGRLEARLHALVEQRADDHPGKDHADGQAILRRARIEVVGEVDAAGARHVLDHDRRLARDVLGNMPRQRPRVDVVAAAGIAADDHGDGLLGVEVVGNRRAGEHAAEADEGRQHSARHRSWSQSIFSGPL